MKESGLRDKVIEEIDLIPEHKLSEIYDLVHYFRIGLQQSKEGANPIMKFAGCWQDMPDEEFTEFLEEIGQRRKHAFSGRRNNEAGID
ncbi:MAG: hypothetical protein AB1611_14120 [bacterium]